MKKGRRGMASTCELKILMEEKNITVFDNPPASPKHMARRGTS